MNKVFPYKHLDTGATLLLVLGDFGREATLRFCSSFAEAEKTYISQHLPEGAYFFDEYRHTALGVIGDLPYLKKEHLPGFTPRLLDNRILVNFPGGLTIDDLIPGLVIMTLQALAGPVSRGINHVVVAQPCNTLAPASWKMESLFRDKDALNGIIRRQPPAERDWLSALVDKIHGESFTIRFPTVPTAVLKIVDRAHRDQVLPLGTANIAQTYEQAARRSSSNLRILEPTDRQEALILESIKVSISGDPRSLSKHRKELDREVRNTFNGTMDRTVVVEACTDLNFGIGLNSNQIYASSVADLIYKSYYADPEN